MSIEPVVGAESDPYAIKEEDLPVIKEEYERLAKIYHYSTLHAFSFHLTADFVGIMDGSVEIIRILRRKR